jgi:hypothetical protein
MAMEMGSDHGCENLPCKCHGEGEFCSEFCKEVETSSDDLKCGRGHMACDTNTQMGNEETFAATGS